MTLSEIIRTTISDSCGFDLSPETRVGKANRVDFLGSSDLIGPVRLEIERRRADPVNNVVKAWRQADENPSEPAFTLVHVFSGFYASNKSKFQNATFVGKMMNEWAESRGKRIMYLAVQLDFEPPIRDADPVITDEKIAHTIREQIRRQCDGRFS